MRPEEQINLELEHISKELDECNEEHPYYTFLQGYKEALEYVLEENHSTRFSSNLVRSIEQFKEKP